MAYVDSFPRVGESRFAEVKGPFVGGKGFNQAVAAHNAGAKTLFVGCVGNDADGDAFVRELEKLGMSTEGVMRSKDRSTAQALVFVNHEGNNLLCIDPGANHDLSPDWISKFVSPDSLVLTQLETPDSCIEAAAVGKLILNPAPARQLPAGLIAKAWMITPNEHEAHALGAPPSDSPEQVVRFLASAGCPRVAVTLGDQGSCVTDGERIWRVGTPAVQAVDATGAGDTYNGYLAAELAKGTELGKAVMVASAAAAMSTTKQGAAPAIPTRTELEAQFGDWILTASEDSEHPWVD